MYMSTLHYIKQAFFACALLFVISCKKDASNELSIKSNMEDIKRSEFAEETFSNALIKARNNEEDGFLKLYEISQKPDKYTVEYQEGANDALTELLYTKTELWIKVFSKTAEFKFYFGVLPAGVSENKYDETVLINLNKIKGNKDENRLAMAIKEKLRGD